MTLMSVQPRQLIAFLEVCRLQSFSKAAEQIPMSQSGISMLIKEIESSVGVRLFDRTTRSVTPTDAGRKLEAAAQRILGELSAFDESIAGTRARLTSRLAVAATPTVSAHLLPPVIRGFAQSHPSVTVQLSDVDIVRVREKVLDGEVDLGLGFFFKPAVGLSRTPICKFRLMLVSPAQGPAVGVGPSRSWSNAAALPLISLPPDNPIQSLIESHLKRHGRAHESRPTMNLIGTLVAMVEAGLGHAIMPSFALPDCLRRKVAVSMLVEPAVHIDLYGVTRRGVEAKPMASDFTAALKRAAARLAG